MIHKRAIVEMLRARSLCTRRGFRMSFDASSVFFRHLDEVPFMDLAANLDKARPAPGSKARIKWLGGDSATGPWVYYIEHPAGAIIKPHKHHAPRIEYVLAGEIEFFL